jgi:apolipoprotein N-acyltransferase
MEVLSQKPCRHAKKTLGAKIMVDLAVVLFLFCLVLPILTFAPIEKSISEFKNRYVLIAIVLSLQVLFTVGLYWDLPPLFQFLLIGDLIWATSVYLISTVLTRASFYRRSRKIERDLDIKVSEPPMKFVD